MLELPPLVAGYEFWLNILWWSPVYAAFASGVTTVWTRWIAVATAALFFLAYVSIAACLLVWYYATSPSCENDGCKPEAFFILFGPIYIFFYLMLMLFGALAARLLRWGIGQARAYLQGTANEVD